MPSSSLHLIYPGTRACFEVKSVKMRGRYVSQYFHFEVPGLRLSMVFITSEEEGMRRHSSSLWLIIFRVLF